ncbi:hypothetical protein ACFY7C_22125 [Streptomyces sp. NPDC012769]|uniref:hypothetical protein n=1 Tax=Streptomyces sp. NPDC012769 TaxID=3364848 RepID=UPI0036ABA273
MTVTRTARLTGAALCAALALVIVVWLLRDLAAFGPTTELLWYWAGDHRFRSARSTATTLVDALLILVYAATAVAAVRSPLAASAFAVTGLTTLALRLHGLWTSGVEVLLTTLLTLALAAGLVVTAAAGRRDDGPDTRVGAAPGTGTGAGIAEAPGRPRTGPAVAAGVLCATAALLWAGWELRWATLLPADYTVSRFTGGRGLMLPALAVPPAWLNTVLVLLLLAAAVSAFARARPTRPLGLVAGLLLAGVGAGGAAAVLRPNRHTYTAEQGLYSVAYDLGCFFSLLAGLAVLVLLARSGHPRRVPYRPPAALPPAPPTQPPPGW